MRIKICGITRPEDARAAAEAGADAIGLVFAPTSPRRITPERALEICRALPPFVSCVGLFMDATADFVRSVLSAVPLDRLQFHGEEDAEFCRGFQRPWIKAIAMADPRAGERMNEYADADAVLFDSHAPGQAGGTGQTFDWKSFDPPARAWILAGGLNPDNVAAACRALDPPAVDVSSGVESSRGIKDPEKMERFVRAVREFTPLRS